MLYAIERDRIFHGNTKFIDCHNFVNDLLRENINKLMGDNFSKKHNSGHTKFVCLFNT